MVTCCAVLDQVTVRSSSPASTSTSLSRGSKRRMLTVPEASTTAPRLDRGDPAHRDEDAVPVLHLDDQAEDARRLAVDAQGGHRFADPADLIAVRVEYADTRQPGDEHPGGRGHVTAPSWSHAVGARLPLMDGWLHSRLTVVVFGHAKSPPVPCPPQQPHTGRLVAEAAGRRIDAHFRWRHDRRPARMASWPTGTRVARRAVQARRGSDRRRGDRGLVLGPADRRDRGPGAGDRVLAQRARRRWSPSRSPCCGAAASCGR